MKCSAFIATSADGYIATEDGSVDWLENAGRADVDMGSDADMGFGNYIASVDCMVMGRKCMEKIASFNLSPEQWPYGDIRIIVLSNSLNELPDSLKDKMELYSGSLPELVSGLEQEGYQHAYVDGGTTITGFLKLELMDEITVTQAPVLLGAGLQLFGKIKCPIKLVDAEARAYGNDFIQYHYRISYQ